MSRLLRHARYMDALPFPVSTRRVLAAVLLAVAVGALAVRHLVAHAQPAALRVAPVQAPAAQRRASRAAPGVVVDVEGAVRRPGLIRLQPGSRVADAVARAGGTTRHADRSGVNLAAPVSDGQQILVPRRGAATSSTSPAATGGSASAPLSLSTATPEQLDSLPGVGPVTAQKIVDYRTRHGAFHSVDELDAIPGIGPARLADLREVVVP
ncbi:MAG: helix-hairpin-helix domain-containing protein [Gaiellaceae bacterium]